MTYTHYSDENKKKKKDAADSANNVTSPKNKKLKRPREASFSWCEEPYNTARGESSLWVAVITQAMMDALSRSRNSEAIYHKHEAIQWLTGNSKDFKQVCLMAGKEPSDVRRKAKRALVSPIAWRAAPGKGKRYQERKAYRQRLKKGQSHPSPQPLQPSEIPNNVIIGPW